MILRVVNIYQSHWDLSFAKLGNPRFQDIHRFFIIMANHGHPGGVDGDPHVHTLAARRFFTKKKHTLRIQDYPEVSWWWQLDPWKNHSDGKCERILRDIGIFWSRSLIDWCQNLDLFHGPSDSLEGLARRFLFLSQNKTMWKRVVKPICVTSCFKSGLKPHQLYLIYLDGGVPEKWPIWPQCIRIESLNVS